MVTGEETWTVKTLSSGDRFEATIRDAAPAENYGGFSLDVLCSHNKAPRFTSSAGVWVANTGDGLRLRWKDISGADSIFGDVTAFTAYLAEQYAAGTPVTYVYRVDQPRTIQLTPHQLTMLKGSNALWSDTGYTDVAYIADTRTYVDDRVYTWERSGLTIATLGDSIMAGDGNGGVGIGEILAGRIGGTCWRYAKGGATIGWDANDAASSSANTQRQNIQYQADLLIAEHATPPDIILLEGGTNDVGTPTIQTGEISEGYDAALDNTTFAGGLETIVKKLKTAYPTSAIIFVRVHRMLKRDNAKQELYGDMAAQICDKWSVGMADIFHRSGFNTFLDCYLPYTVSPRVGGVG